MSADLDVPNRPATGCRLYPGAGEAPRVQSRRTAPMTPSAIRYAWRQLAQRAGVTGGDAEGTGLEGLGIRFYYRLPQEVEPGEPAIIVAPSSGDAWHELLQRAPRSLLCRPAAEVMPPAVPLPLGHEIPVLLWGEGYEDGSKPFAQQRADGSVVFYADIVGATLLMLARWEETVNPTRDEHGRFPARASLSTRQGILDRPLVDEYALILRAWIKALLPQWTPRRRRFSVKLTHDVDSMRYFASLGAAARTLGGDLLKRRSLNSALETCVRTICQTLTPERATPHAGIWTLAELSRALGLDSAFYFMTANTGPFASDYSVESRPVRRCIHRLRDRGFEVGLHGSYRASHDPERLSAEKARLDAILGETRYGGRQHYLRFDAPSTWRHWERAGLHYDSTLSYADHEGFRCGTCHPYRPFDLEQDRELALQEWPLIVMDCTLHGYRRQRPTQALARILELAQRCRQVEGAFTLLWHNPTGAEEWHAWYPIYQRAVARLAEAVQTARANTPNA